MLALNAIFCAPLLRKQTDKFFIVKV